MAEPDLPIQPRAEGTRPSTTGEAAHVPTDAFEAFYRDTASPLVRFLMLQGASIADAAEIAQDTLVSAYTHWNTLDNPRAWSYRVASRAWIRKVSSIQDIPCADPPAPSPLLRATPIEAWHLQHELITALATLAPRQRQVMAWTLLGYTPAEIAIELHLSGDVVRSNLRYARRNLAAALHTEGDTA